MKEKCLPFNPLQFQEGFGYEQLRMNEKWIGTKNDTVIFKDIYNNWRDSLPFQD